MQGIYESNSFLTAVRTAKPGVPIRDIWSNEGGGWEAESSRRRGDRLAIEKMRTDLAESLASTSRGINLLSADHAAAREAFTGKFGSAALSGLVAVLMRADAGDTLELGPEAVAMLRDLDRIERLRNEIDARVFLDRHMSAVTPLSIEHYEAGKQMSAAFYDVRFNASDDVRVEAARRIEELRAQSAVLQQRIDVEKAGFARERAAREAAGAVVAAGLGASDLFEVTKDGRILLDANGLDGLAPDARQRRQLARLAEVLAARNGLAPVQGLLADALAAQNDYIANHPVVVAANPPPATGPAAPNERQLKIARADAEARGRLDELKRRGQAYVAAARAAPAAAAPVPVDPKAADHEAALALLTRIADGLRDARSGIGGDALARALMR